MGQFTILTFFFSNDNGHQENTKGQWGKQHQWANTREMSKDVTQHQRKC
jgi:hypothetical protein